MSRLTGCPVPLLRISRGRTRFPLRPVLTDRFLIGGSPSCDLCLAGADVPPLHSLIVGDGRSFRWEAMLSHPVVLHNGLAQESFPLQDGDRVEIAGVEITIAIQPLTEVAADLGIDPEALTTGSESMVRRDDQPAFSEDCEDEAQLEHLTVGELVDRLVSDLSGAEAFQRKRELGAEALLHAAGVEALPAVETPDDGSESDAGRQLLGEMKSLVSRMGLCAAELERRAGEIVRGQESLSATLCDVLEAERMLADRLTAVLQGRSNDPIVSDETLSAA